jgi:hypothetical protein
MDKDTGKANGACHWKRTSMLLITPRVLKSFDGCSQRFYAKKTRQNLSDQSGVLRSGQGCMPQRTLLRPDIRIHAICMCLNPDRLQKMISKVLKVLVQCHSRSSICTTFGFQQLLRMLLKRTRSPLTATSSLSSFCFFSTLSSILRATSKLVNGMTSFSSSITGVFSVVRRCAAAYATTFSACWGVSSRSQ